MLGQTIFRSTFVTNEILTHCIGSFNFLTIRGVHHHMERSNLNRYLGISRSNKHKANRNTHMNEKKWRQARGRKNIAVILPNYRQQEEMDNMKPSEIRTMFLRRGFNMSKEVGARDWPEKQLTMHSFYGVLDGYISPESVLPILPSFNNFGNTATAKTDEVKMRIKNRWFNYFSGIRRIKKKEGFRNFKLVNFCAEAEQIYVEAYNALAQRDKNKLLIFITEHAYEKLWPDVEKGTLKWEHCGFQSPSKAISVRCADYPYKSGNDIAQVVVRMHSIQKYSLYDRFGRLLLGSPTEPKEIVEYVVFENHIAREGSLWRLHDKIYPNWSNKKDAIQRPVLLSNLSSENRPTSMIPIGEGWTKKTQRDEEKFAEKEFEEKGVRPVTRKAETEKE